MNKEDKNFNYKRLHPFKWFILENYPFLEDSIDVLTNYQLFCKLGEMYNKEIDAINMLGIQVEGITDWFDNLDVQEEINNKLDVMAEDGTLDQIINQEIFGQLNQDISDLEDTIGDLDNLNTPENNNIVNAINTNNQLQQVYLGNGIMYDIPEDVGHVQGSCINENNLYVAVQGDGTVGTIYVFNISSNTYVTKYTNVTMYHGNDLTFINNKIYIASVDSLSICIYDLSTNTSSVINPFTLLSEYDELVGVEKIDNNHMMCWLKKTDGTNTIATDKFVNLDLTTYDYIDFTINDDLKVLVANGSVTRQNICLDNNILYVLMAVPNIIYKANIVDNTIKFVKIYNLPEKDIHSNPVGELESLAIINNSLYPSGSIMITGRTFETFKNTNSVYTEDTICNYIFSPKTGNFAYPFSNISEYPVRGTNSFGYTSVSKSVGNLIEIGSSTYPYKNLMRGINGALKGSYSPNILQIIDSSTYYLPYLFGIQNLEININANCNPTIYIGDIENCKITFNVINTGTLTIKPIADNKRITFTSCDLTFYAATSQAIIFNECQLLITMGSYAKFRRCKFLNTESVSSTKAIDVNDGSFALAQFDSFTVGGSDKKIGFGGCAFVVTNVESTSIIHSGAGAMITMTNS